MFYHYTGNRSRKQAKKRQNDEGWGLWTPSELSVNPVPTHHSLSELLKWGPYQCHHARWLCGLGVKWLVLKDKKMSDVKCLDYNRRYNCQKARKEREEKKIEIGIKRRDFLITHQEVSLSGKYRLHMHSRKNVLTKTREGWRDVSRPKKMTVKPFPRK